MVFKSLFKPQFVVIQFEVRQAVPDYRQEKKCKFFTWSERARGTLNSLQLRRFGPSFLWLFKVQALCNDGGDCLMFMIDGVDEGALCVAD